MGGGKAAPLITAQLRKLEEDVAAVAVCAVLSQLGCEVAEQDPGGRPALRVAPEL